MLGFLGIMRAALGLLSSLKTLIWLAVLVLIMGFGYLFFTNGMDVEAAYTEILGYATATIEWLKGAWDIVLEIFL